MSERAKELERHAAELEEAQRFAEAVEAYRALVATAPGDGRAWYRLGRMLHRERDWIAAAAAYQHAIALGGGTARRYYRLGGALERSGDLRQARAAYRRSERLRPPPATLDGEPGHSLPYARRIDLNLLQKSSYAYLVLRAAKLAVALGHERISVLELGVAGGNGLLSMEAHAVTVEELTGVGIDVYGLDTGTGLFAPRDHRDMPYLFTEGNYAMDVEALTARLTRARLILGDAVTTLPQLLAEGPAPIGAISFDMDLYSATRPVLDVLGDMADDARFLPRVRAYFDDVVGKGDQDYNEFAGELLAIREFNAATDQVKIDEDRYFRTLPVTYSWHNGMYTMHRFSHPEYATYISPAGADSLALRD